MYFAFPVRFAGGPVAVCGAVGLEGSRDLLEPLLAAVVDLGRLPDPEEFSQAAEVVARFRMRPPLLQLPRTLQRDLRAFFGGYCRACALADEPLFRAGDAAAIDDACKRSPGGKLLRNALYVHRSALDGLEPLLRVYEGCGRAYFGEVEGANVVKVHRFSGKLSYLAYPDFDSDPHPALRRCVKLSLRTRELECYDYATSDNPPVLHRKEAFVQPEHPLPARFARLTRQEERHGLLDDTASIGTRAGDEKGTGTFIDR